MAKAEHPSRVRGEYLRFHVDIGLNPKQYLLIEKLREHGLYGQSDSEVIRRLIDEGLKRLMVRQ